MLCQRLHCKHCTAARHSPWRLRVELAAALVNLFEHGADTEFNKLFIDHKMHFDRCAVLAGAAETIGGVLFGRLSDKIGATPVMLFGCGATHALAFVLVYINFIASTGPAVFTCWSISLCWLCAASRSPPR